MKHYPNWTIEVVLNKSGQPEVQIAEPVHRKLYVRWLESFIGRRMSMQIEPEIKAGSPEQQAYYRVLCRACAAHIASVTDNPKKDAVTETQFHHMIGRMFLTEDRDTPWEHVHSTADLNSAEFSLLIQSVGQYMLDDYGFVIPEAKKFYRRIKDAESESVSRKESA